MRRSSIEWLGIGLALAIYSVACGEDGDGGGGDDGGTQLREPPVLSVLDESAPLTELGAQAISLSPAWLRRDLGLALRRQEAARADELAALLIDLDDPRLLDEVAFTIAHTSSEVLANEQFVPGLLVENARGVYARDEDLDYVRLVDVGEPGADDDFWTTAAYRFLWKEAVVEKEIDRETYYWFVVHPKLEDEQPWYIDAWATCGSATLECASTPDEGWFWRDFLWDAADGSCPEEGLCPTLDEWLTGVEYVWDGRRGGDAGGAVRRIIDFMHHSPVDGYRWLVFGAWGERSIQPNRIYGLGRGNCGEWADMTSAIGRTALIPNLNASPASWDHTWNSFWSDGWIEWEPVNVWVDHDYGAPFSNYGARGDGFVLLQTEDYTDDTFTMEVEVYDSEGVPIPGASVAAYSPWEIEGTLYWSYAGEAPTDADGVAAFPLVAMQSYAVRIETPIGSWPEEENYITYASEGIAAGQTDVQSYNLAVPLPARLDLTETGFEGDADAVLKVGLADLETRFVTLGQRFSTTFTTAGSPLDLTLALIDGDNLARLEAGEPAEAAWIFGEAKAQVSIPTSSPWYLVVANDGQISAAALGHLTIEIEPMDDASWAGDSQFETDFEILPLGRMVVGIVPAE